MKRLRDALLGQTAPAWSIQSTSSGLSKHERMIWHNREQRYPRLGPHRGSIMYLVAIGATREVLERRAGYGGRKGRAARRKLGISIRVDPTTVRTAFVLQALQAVAQHDRWSMGTTDLIYFGNLNAPWIQLPVPL